MYEEAMNKIQAPPLFFSLPLLLNRGSTFSLRRSTLDFCGRAHVRGGHEENPGTPPLLHFAPFVQTDLDTSPGVWLMSRRFLVDPVDPVMVRRRKLIVRSRKFDNASLPLPGRVWASSGRERYQGDTFTPEDISRKRQKVTLCLFYLASDIMPF